MFGYGCFVLKLCGDYDHFEVRFRVRRPVSYDDIGCIHVEYMKQQHEREVSINDKRDRCKVKAHHPTQAHQMYIAYTLCI